MKNSSIFFAFSAIIMAITGCTKYDQDGSLLHLRSPAKRILGIWESVRVQEVGVESDTNLTELLGSNNLQLELEFRDDETVTVHNLGENIVYEGDWLFNEDFSVLQLNVTAAEDLGPFYADAAGTDFSSYHQTVANQLMSFDTLFFVPGTVVSITDSIVPYAAMIMSAYTAFSYQGGNAFYDFQIGDDVTAVMADFIDDLIAEGLISNQDDIQGIIQGMLSEYGVELFFQSIEALVTGWDDPTLTQVLFNEFGIDADLFVGTLATESDDAIILDYILSNEGLMLTPFFLEEVKTINAYWKILELELDDMQAYQFREYDGEDIYDYTYLLRFEKKD